MALGGVVSLDALGTLVELSRPAPLLAAELRARGAQVDEPQAVAGIRAEIAYYRAHLHLGADRASLEVLRRRCADVLAETLRGSGANLDAVGPDGVLDALLAALRFEPYPEVAGALRELRAAGHPIVVVSNWDVSLHEMLRVTGLYELVDAAVSSAEAGVAKPSPEIFARALAQVGCDAGGGLHAGDSLEADVRGALAAGLRPVLVARAADAGGQRTRGIPDGVAVVAGLDELARLAA